MELVERSVDILDQVEADHVAPLTECLLEGMKEIAEAARETRVVRPSLGNFRRNLYAHLTSIWRASTRKSGELIMAFFAEGFKSFSSTKSAELYELILSDYIEGFGKDQLRQILSTSERQIQDMISGGMSRGEAIEAVYTAFLEKAPEIARLRALVITRTEAHAAAQFASLKVALRSSVPLVKVWNSVRDERTRDFGELGKISQFNHRVMDGTAVALTSQFLVPTYGGGFEPLDFPGDPRGSAGNIINCRCVQTYERAR